VHDSDDEPLYPKKKAGQKLVVSKPPTSKTPINKPPLKVSNYDEDGLHAIAQDNKDFHMDTGDESEEVMTSKKSPWKPTTANKGGKKALKSTPDNVLVGLARKIMETAKKSTNNCKKTAEAGQGGEKARGGSGKVGDGERTKMVVEVIAPPVSVAAPSAPASTINPTTPSAPQPTMHIIPSNSSEGSSKVFHGGDVWTCLWAATSQKIV
jgi:hypothetical protein